DGTELVDADMRRRDFRRLRQQDRHAIAALNAMRAQHIGEAVGRLPQPAVADIVSTAVAMHMQDGETLRLLRRPAVADIDADIVPRRQLPAELADELVIGVGAGKHAGRNAIKSAGLSQRVRAQRGPTTKSGTSLPAAPGCLCASSGLEAHQLDASS